ncbi:ParB/RepB/Spo0J family partition protein [Nocardiopsis sp. EMB25]|uniref:ParB/RepB/Spo0J family partition protein n=1 Tax=Nocardiopsis sp. EMB25 TaxID=2835867 RepID=UPI002284EC7A|nr:ParB/RepB/Spo0J family partition protein [Nocardiopsis sp. EMB25]MCY9786614.1 ParB/RepB/Spo0J family partition protein [Nocardiopsis sp. EMB25]
MATTSERVPVDLLLDADSPRVEGVDPDHVERLTERIDELPPILVHRTTMRVIDGMHRLQAARLSNRATIEVIYFDGPDPDCFIAAVEANIRHGLPLTLSDRKESAKKILATHPEWSDRAIAAKVGLSGKTVGALRRSSVDPAAQSAVRVGLDGRVRAVNPDEGRQRVADLLARSPDASLRQISRMARVSVETVRDVREQLASANGPPAREEPPSPDGDGDTVGEVRVTADHPASTGLGERVDTRNRGTKQRSAEARPIDLGVVLDSLKKDPTLRYNDEGRTMIRWLETRVIRHDEADLVEHIPPHQAARIAAVARACAMNWNVIATLLERRGEQSSPANGT